MFLPVNLTLQSTCLSILLTEETRNKNKRKQEDHPKYPSIHNLRIVNMRSNF